MKTYKVGGFVRDTLLGLTPKDIDYVVVGATEADVAAMLEQGFQQVGADFPVFLHPVTGDEYALARTERKVAAGYNGFEAYTSPELTVEDDLMRRDLTINAMAIDPDTGEVIDPFNGQADLKSGILRHVSPAFAEDPLRILRVARFAARYGFGVAQETLVLMQKIVDAGELQHLAKERVWVELEKILGEKDAARGLSVLHQVGGLREIFVDPSAGPAFNFATRNRDEFNIMSVMGKFIALTWGFGYDERFMDSLRVPTDIRKGYKMFINTKLRYGMFDNLTASSKIQFLMDIGAFNNAATFSNIRGVLAWITRSASVSSLQQTIAAAKTVDCETVAKNNRLNVAEAIFAARVAAIAT